MTNCEYKHFILPIAFFILVVLGIIIIVYSIYTSGDFTLNIPKEEKLTIDIVNKGIEFILAVSIVVLVTLGIKNKGYNDVCVWTNPNFYWEMITVSLLPALGYLYFFNRRTKNETISPIPIILFTTKFAVLHGLLEFSQYYKYFFEPTMKNV